jgi:hypothetical protein
MPDNIIKEQIAKLDPTYKEFLLSGEVGAIVEPFIKHHSFDDDQEVMLENAFVLYLIFLFSFTDLTYFINTEIGLNKKEATLLAHGLKLALPNSVREYVEEQSEIIFEEVTEELVTEVEPNNIATDIAETEASLASLSRVRTMATDSAQVGYQSTEEPVYTSVQSALLNESK